LPGEFEAKAKQINRRAQKKGGEVESEVRNIFWKAGGGGQVAGGELQVAELTVYKTVETTTIIRPERGEFCDHSAVGNS